MTDATFVCLAFALELEIGCAEAEGCDRPAAGRRHIQI